MAIAGAAVVEVFRSTGAGLGNISVATRTLEAAGLAQSLLAATGLTRPLVAGEDTGRIADGYTWRSRVTAVGANPAPRGSTTGTILYRVDVTVTWPSTGRPRSVSLAGYRIGPGTAEP